MNNIQKAFKNKSACGLRRSYADGGIVEGVFDDDKKINAAIASGDAASVAQYTNNPDALNAASTNKWAAEEARRQAQHPGQAFLNPVVQTQQANPLQKLGSQITGLTDALKPKPMAPVTSTFQEDIDARQARIGGLRSRLGYADGGVVSAGETRGERLMREMAEKYGAPAAGPQPAPQPAPQPVQAAPVPQPAPQPQGRGILNILSNRGKQIDKAAGYAKGGTVDGKGFIHGEKGVDKVAAEVAETGEPIRVGDGERIVNKEQNAALEKLTAAHGMELDDYLQEATGEPVGPTLKKGLRAAEGGWSVANTPDEYAKAVQAATGDFVDGAKRNVMGTAGLVNAGIGAVMQAPAMATDAVKNGFASLTGMERPDPHADLGAAQYMMNEGLDSAKRNFAPIVNMVKDATGWKAAAPAAKAPAAEVPVLSADEQEAMREKELANALSGGAPVGLRNDKSMAYLRDMGVDTSMRFDPRDDVNTVNGNGPERVKGGAVTTINTQNGPVYAGRDKKGQLVVTSGLDRTPEEQAAATKSGYDQAVAQAAKDKADLRQMQRDRYIRDTGSDITDPEVQKNGAYQLARMDKEDEAAAKASALKEEMGLRRGMLDHHANELAERKRQYDEGVKLQRELAAAGAKKEGIADFDKLVAEAGFDKDEAVKFKDWFRGNYAGRKQKIGDKVVDVPGFEDMSADERRAHMTNAKALYALTNELNKTEMKGRTSMAVPKRLVERDLTFDDVRRHQSGLLAGMPVLHSDDPNAPGLIGDGGLVNRLWVPDWLGGKNKRVVEEVDENGKGLRRWLRYNTRGEMGPWGNQDTAAYINDITTQK